MTTRRYLVLIEDNDDDAELLRLTLRRQNITNELIRFGDGESALEYLFAPDTALPEFIMLDLKLPRMDGFEVLKRLRANNRTTLIPIFVFTSSDSDVDRVTSLQLGIEGYIRKSEPPRLGQDIIKVVHNSGIWTTWTRRRVE